MTRISYIRRNPGDIVNGAVLLKKINNQKWEMKCGCGNVYIAQPSMTNGKCHKCNYKIAWNNKTIHGESPDTGKNASRLYRIWLSMRSRCYNPNTDSYRLYGGRGIKVCNEWNNYLNFKQWSIENGYTNKLTLDRINADGDYTPDNCRWVTWKAQARNKRNNHLITFHGETKTMADWADDLGISYNTLKRRINNYGFTIEEAFTLPVRNGSNQNLRFAERR